MLRSSPCKASPPKWLPASDDCSDGSALAMQIQLMVVVVVNATGGGGVMGGWVVTMGSGDGNDADDQCQQGC